MEKTDLVAFFKQAGEHCALSNPLNAVEGTGGMLLLLPPFSRTSRTVRTPSTHPPTFPNAPLPGESIP